MDDGGWPKSLTLTKVVLPVPPSPTRKCRVSITLLRRENEKTGSMELILDWGVAEAARVRSRNVKRTKNKLECWDFSLCCHFFFSGDYSIEFSEIVWWWRRSNSERGSSWRRSFCTNLSSQIKCWIIAFIFYFIRGAYSAQRLPAIDAFKSWRSLYTTV